MAVDLHYLRNKDGAEVDFALSDSSNPEPTLTHLIECKLSELAIHGALARFAKIWPNAQAVQLMLEPSTEQDRSGVMIRNASQWLCELDV